MSSNINRCRTSKDRMAKNIKKRSNVMTITTHNPAVSKFVPIKSQQEFYKDNLEYHNKFVVKDSRLHSNRGNNVEIFSVEAWRYLELEADESYVACEIIDITDLVSEGVDMVAGGHYITQSARKGQNKKAKAIRESIEEKGFDLSTIPIAVHKEINSDGTYEYILLDGRTRVSILRDLKVKNIIVDIFIIPRADRRLVFGTNSNSSASESGKSTKEDYLYVLQELIGLDSPMVTLPLPFKNIKIKQKGGTERRAKIASALSYVVKDKLSLNTITEPDLRWVINQCIEKSAGERTLRNFPNGNGIKAYLEDINNDFETYASNSTVLYMPFSGKSNTNQSKAFQEALGHVSTNPGLRVEIILYGGAPDPHKPDTDWYESTWLWWKKYDDLMKKMCKIFGGTEDSTKGVWNNMPSTIRIAGAVPQVESLSNRFPMERLVTKLDFLKDAAQQEAQNTEMNKIAAATDVEQLEQLDEDTKMAAG